MSWRPPQPPGGRGSMSRLPSAPDEKDAAMRRRVQALREEFTHEVGVARDKAEQMLDWRFHVQKRPLLCVGAAALAGYLLAPTARRVVELTDDQVDRLAERGGIRVATKGARGATGEVASSLLAAAAAFAARSAMTQLVARFGVSNESGTHESPTKPDHR